MKEIPALSRGERVARRRRLSAGAGRVRGSAATSRNGGTEVRVTLDEIDHWMTQVTDVLVNTSTKLNSIAELNLVLGRKLDRLADLSTNTEQKIDRLADKIDKLADASAATNLKMDRLVEALLRREGQ
jgi:hypothetical protein